MRELQTLENPPTRLPEGMCNSERLSCRTCVRTRLQQYGFCVGKKRRNLTDATILSDAALIFPDRGWTYTSYKTCFAPG